MEKWYSIREVAEKYSYSPATMRNKVLQGEIRGERLGKTGHWRVSESELQRVFKTGKQAGDMGPVQIDETTRTRLLKQKLREFARTNSETAI